MEWFCKNPAQRARRWQMSDWCTERGKTCAEMPVTNFLGNKVRLPYCCDRIPIARPADEGVQLVPVYEGHKTLPDEAWSPGTFDAFFQLAHEYASQAAAGASSSPSAGLAGLRGRWEYRGHYASGASFFDRNDTLAHSWSCLGCPSGTLYVETVGFTSEAVGFSSRVSFT